MLSETQKMQITMLQDIFEISESCNTKTYVWGGLVIDILEGRFLREHGDIDGFTLNLLDVKEESDAFFKRKGYTTEFTPGIDMYKITTGACHAAFNRLEIEKDTAMWQHIGNEGTVYFPANWLNNTPLSFYESRAYISGPEFEYSIKARVNLLSPEWQLRDTDKATLDYFRKILEQRGLSTDTVLHKVKSDNP